ncbi:MAG TPA: hypothetical protein VFZ11_03400 [Gemmatimonadaceae bacterium]
MTRPLALALAVLVAACGGARAEPDPDADFAAVQERGRVAMGVDQYTSTHVFEDLPDGGRIVLDREDAGDAAGIATIRAHMRDIATAFARGDFALPGFVHAREVPGTAEMARLRDRIRYEAVDRPRGAEVRIRAEGDEAVRAVHAFLAFQRTDHRAAGHEHGPHR